MKFSTIILAAAATMSPLVQGQFANVVNDCSFNAYVQSVSPLLLFPTTIKPRPRAQRM